MQTTITQLTELYDQVRPVLIKAGLTKLQSVAHDFSKIKDEDETETALVWLKSFSEIRITAYLKARNLVSEKQWIAYENIGATGLYEQNELNRAKKALLEEWRHRPNAFRKVKLPKPKPKNKAKSRKAKVKK
jgi:hypothetical protein